MKKEIMSQVAAMKVVEMRKVASQYGIKSASKYRRAELEKVLVEAMFDAMLKAAKEKAAAERAAEKEAAAKAAEEKAAKRNDKNTKKNAKVTKKSDKRYKAANLKATKEEIEAMADDIVNKNFGVMDFMEVNRKVLIVVMKKLHCEKWYRTYDKPTMVKKIMAAM